MIISSSLKSGGLATRVHLAVRPTSTNFSLRYYPFLHIRSIHATPKTPQHDTENAELRRFPAGGISLSLKPVPSLPKLLGFAGLVPFLATTAGCLYGPQYLVASQIIQSYYGASILSFMGAVHWGTEMAGLGGQHRSRYVVSVIPSLLSFGSLLLPSSDLSLITQLIGFLGLLAYDIRMWRRGLINAWYPNLRMWLTSIVGVCMSTTLYLGYKHYYRSRPRPVSNGNVHLAVDEPSASMK